MPGYPLQVVTATVQNSRRTLQVKSVEVTQDAAWSPRYRVRLDIVAPHDPVVIAELDPLAGNRLEIQIQQSPFASDPLSDWAVLGDQVVLSTYTSVWGGQPLSLASSWFGVPALAVMPTKPDPWRTLLLSIRGFDYDEDTDTASLTLASREIELQDYKLTRRDPIVFGASAGLHGIITRVLREAGLDAAWVSVGDLAGVMTSDTVIWQTGVSAWDFLEPILIALDRVLVADDDGIWRAPLTGTDGNAGFLPVNLTPTRVTASKTRDGDYYNTVLLKWTSKDIFGKFPDVVQWQEASNANAAPRKVLYLEYEGVAVDGAAANLLARVSRGQADTRTTSWDVETALDASTRLGMTVFVPTVDGGIQGRVRAATFKIPEGTMTLRIQRN